MRRSQLVHLLCWLTLAFVSTSPAVGDEGNGLEWIRDMEVAQKLAAERGQELLIIFTGRGWCQPCELFDLAVVRQQEFADGVASHYVCVEFDMNFGETDEELQREKVFRKLQQEYLATGVPSVLLTDASGAPYFMVVGPVASEGPKPIVAQILAARSANAERLRRLQDAVQLSGADLAAAQHEALLQIVPFLQPHSRGDDPLLTFYDDEIQQIKKATPADSPIVEFYRAREQARDAKLREHGIYDELHKLLRENDHQKILDYVTATLAEETDDQRRCYFELTRVQTLAEAGKHQEALQHIARLLADETLSDQNFASLCRCELASLAAIGEAPEGAARMNAHIAAAEERPKLQLELRYQFANCLEYQPDMRPEASSAWAAYRDATAPNTFDRLTGAAFLGRSLKKEGNHREAVAMFAEIRTALELSHKGEIELKWPWEYERRGFITLAMAESLIELGDQEAADKLIAEVETLAKELALSPTNGEREDAARLQEKLKAIRER